MLVDDCKLQNPQQKVPGLNVVRTIGQIVTGTVPVTDIESVVHDNVISLKRATELHSNLQFSVKEIRAIQSQLLSALPVGTSD